MALTKITTSVVAVNSLTAANIADNTIDATKIAQNQILARHIANATALTLDGGVTIDNITIDGTEIDLSSGDLTIDVAGVLNLDAGTQIILKDDGTNYGTFYQSSSDFYIQSLVQDKDLVFYGNDDGSGVTALRLDMSDAGKATFNSGVVSANDSDTQSIFGRTAIGFVTGLSDYAYVGHLDVADSGGYALVQSAAGATFLNAEDGQDLSFSIHGTRKMVLDDSGNLGVSRTDPTRPLDVKLTATNASLHNNSTACAHFGSQGNADGEIQGISLGYKTDGANTYSKTAVVARGLNDGAARQSLAFLVDTAADGGSAEIGDSKLEIHGTTGLVGVGRSTQWIDTNDALGVNGRMFALGLGHTAAAFGRYNSAGNAAEDGNLVDFLHGGSGCGSIAVASNSTTYNTSSDYRLKENISYSWDATTELKKLKPAKFSWKNDSSSTIKQGFLAHEVSNVVDDAVIGSKDAVDSDSKPIYQGIDHSKLVPLLVKTVQELEARIKTLEG